MIDERQFLMWEAASRDTIDFKRIYVDMAEDLIAGLVLSQIVFWNLPDSNGHTKLRIKRNGQVWLAKAQHEWWEECRVTPKQIKRALNLLREKHLIITAVYKFNGAPTTHIRINWDTFLETWDEKLQAQQGQMDLAQRDQSISTKGTNLTGPKGPMGSVERGKSITETTSETPSQTSVETTPPTAQAEQDEAAMQDSVQDGGVGGLSPETKSVLTFLVDECGVWENTAAKLIQEHEVTLGQAAWWWTILRANQDIRNPAAVLVYHLGNKEPPPKFGSISQRHRYEQFLWDYGAAEDEEEAD